MDEKQRALIWELKWGNTLLLLLLSVVTLGGFPIYYVWRQTRIVNRYVDRDERISIVLVGIIILLGLAALLLVVPAVFLEDESLGNLSDISGRVAAVLIILWVLKARRRMNEFLEAEPGDETWFSWPASFFFPVLYFNVKVNSIAKSIAPNADLSDAGTESGPEKE